MSRGETHYVSGSLRAACGRYVIRYDMAGNMVSSLLATSVVTDVSCRTCIRILYLPWKA